MNTQEKIEYIIGWLKSQLATSGMKGFVVGVSGGIDSALTSTLCAKTELPTLLVHMPINQHIYSETALRALHHMKYLINTYEIKENDMEHMLLDLSKIYNSFEKQFTDNNTTEMALVNSKARLRMTALYQLSAARGYLVAGTGNKVEDFGIGFYSKYGDGGVDISPIADLYKSEVYELARELGIDDSILKAIPTDDLWDDNRSDENQIGATYDELENIMVKLGGLKQKGGFLKELTEREKEVAEIYSKHRMKNMHKMLPIPVCIIPKEDK